MTTIGERRERFRTLHEGGLFVMPNAWDTGSARLLEWSGFEAIATTSLGHAASLGRLDQTVTLDELLTHVEALASAVDIPTQRRLRALFRRIRRGRRRHGRATRHGRRVRLLDRGL